MLSVDAVVSSFAEHGYVAERGLAVTTHPVQLGRPLFLEGEAGVGKTEVAKTLAAIMGAELIASSVTSLDASQAL